MPAYQPAGSHIVHDVLEGEAVVLNLHTGVFYSLQGAAAVIWEGIEKHRTVDDIVARLEGMYDGQRDDIQSGVQAFVDQLVEQVVVVEAPPGPPSPLPEPASTRLPFHKPNLLRYDDLEELLLLDPVHEVAPAGWPTQGA